MVHSTFFFIGTLAALSGTAAVVDCVEGYGYCGSNLLATGDYLTIIDTSLEVNNQPTHDDTVNNSLFYCDADGLILYQTTCTFCFITGADTSDHC